MRGLVPRIRAFPFASLPYAARRPAPTNPRSIFSLLGRGELPIRRPMIRIAVLDQAHRRKGAAIEAATGRWPVLIDGAALLPEVNAGAVCAPLEHQFAIGVPLRQEVGQAFPIALLVNRDASVIAAGRAVAARDRPRVAAPPGVEKIACRAVHRALSVVHCCPNPLTTAWLMTRRGAPISAAAAPPPLNPSLTAATRRIAQLRPLGSFFDGTPPDRRPPFSSLNRRAPDLFRASTPFLRVLPLLRRHPARGCTSRSIAAPIFTSPPSRGRGQGEGAVRPRQNSGVVPK